MQSWRGRRLFVPTVFRLLCPVLSATKFHHVRFVLRIEMPVQLFGPSRAVLRAMRERVLARDQLAVNPAVFEGLYECPRDEFACTGGDSIFTTPMCRIYLRQD